MTDTLADRSVRLHPVIGLTAARLAELGEIYKLGALPNAEFHVRFVDHTRHRWRWGKPRSMHLWIVTDDINVDLGRGKNCQTSNGELLVGPHTTKFRLVALWECGD